MHARYHSHMQNQPLCFALNTEKLSRFNFQYSTLASAFSSEQIASYRLHQREDSIRSSLVATVNKTSFAYSKLSLGVLMSSDENVLSILPLFCIRDTIDHLFNPNFREYYLKFFRFEPFFLIYVMSSLIWITNFTNL